MKTAKATKTAKTTKKPVSVKKTAKSTKAEEVATKRHMPTQDEIRAKAKQIYEQRIAHGVSGTPEGDWIKAEDYFKNLKA